MLAGDDSDVWLDTLCTKRRCERQNFAPANHSSGDFRDPFSASRIHPSRGAASAGGPAQAGDAVKGKTVFQRCAICHNAQKDGGNGLGPNLFGIVGRKAGTAPGFSYSAAMTVRASPGRRTSSPAYVTHPAAVVPGNRMAFAGIGNPAQVSDVVRYLRR